MEKNNLFTWKTYELFNDNFKNKNVKEGNNNSNSNNEDYGEKNSFTLTEDYFDRKLSIHLEKYTIDLGACIVNANNNILCFNKYALNNQSNSYFKVDKFFLEKENNSHRILTRNIYSDFDGPRYRVTNVW